MEGVLGSFIGLGGRERSQRTGFMVGSERIPLTIKTSLYLLPV